MKRRDFMKKVAIVGSSAGLVGYGGDMPSKTINKDADVSLNSLPRQGPKPVVRGKRAVCSSSQPIVTETMLKVMKDGGNAVDAGIAGSMVQAVVEPHMTNHAGTVTFLYWEAKTGKAYELNSQGTLVPGLPPFRTYPPNLGGFALGAGPMACIPGFMPGMRELHKRFGTKPWAYLCQDAIRWAEEGHIVHSFEHATLEWELISNTYFPSGRKMFTPDGFTPPVGERFKNPDLAKTLRHVAEEGPEYFTKGGWAKKFVKKANELGWPIKLKHMTEVPPRWGEPLRFKHNGYEVLQLSPPERQGVFCAMVLGILSHLGVKSLGHYTKSAETLYFLAYVLRWAEFELGFLHDPEIFHIPLEEWLSEEHHKRIANVIKKSMPKIDLTEHVLLTSGKPALAAAGFPTAGPQKKKPSIGSCELSIVDPQGNWVQMMNTLQGSGIPGLVIGGVPMVGSHATFDMKFFISGWLTGGGRVRSGIGNTIVLKDGRPYISMGTPGNVHVTIPQVLLNVLDFGMDPYEASDAPRMLAMRDDYVVGIESRIPSAVVADLAKLGIRVHPLPIYDFHMGSFQMCWRDEKTGLYNSSADPRRAGMAGGF